MEDSKKITTLKFPIVSYVWSVSTLYFFFYALFQDMVFWGVCFYTILFSGTLYFFFARYSCKITIDKDRIIFKYFVFWLNDIEVEKDRIHSFDYKRGFYDFGEDIDHLKEKFFLTICYDTIYLKLDDDMEVSINVNIRIGSFKKLKKILNTITVENEKQKSQKTKKWKHRRRAKSPQWR